MSQITKGERTELKSVVRNQFKVLRAELEQREAELDVEVERQVAEKYEKDDLAWEAIQHRIHEIASEANRAVNDVLYECSYQIKSGRERVWIDTPQIRRDETPRNVLRHRAKVEIIARIKAARLRLDREEADLLRTLAIGALETEDAHNFLKAIPTVGELVPSARLAELEAGLIDDEAE